MGLLHRTRTEDHTDDDTVVRRGNYDDDTAVRREYDDADRDTVTERRVVRDDVVDDDRAVMAPTKVRERVTTFAPGQLVWLDAAKPGSAEPGAQNPEP